MNGKHVVIGLFALVLIVGVITFALYLLTRQEEDATGGTGELVPNAVVVENTAAVDEEARLFLLEA